MNTNGGQITTTYDERRRLERLDRDALSRYQLERLNALLNGILPHNRFYARKLGSLPRPLTSLDALREIPFTTKHELAGSGSDNPLAANRTFAAERYVRLHHTSGSRGRPMMVLDTVDDWNWWIDCWQFVLDAAEIDNTDRALLAFSFGPFIGFWSAHDALVARRTMVVPGGGISSTARLDLLDASRATALFSTPTYALRLAEVAADAGRNVSQSSVRVIVVAGEPGGSVPATRRRIERAWGARVVDHSGATEIGAWGYADRAGRGLFVNEARFLPELIQVGTDAPAAPGETAELVLTTLGRYGCPVIRYRTGDLVRPAESQQQQANHFLLLEGGVLGRTDDMLIVRGVNVFPSAVESIVYEFPEVREYRLILRTADAMDEMIVEVEDRLEMPDRIAAALHARLGLRVDVRTAPAGSLPRSDGKARRVIDERSGADRRGEDGHDE